MNSAGVFQIWNANDPDTKSFAYDSTLSLKESLPNLGKVYILRVDRRAPKADDSPSEEYRIRFDELVAELRAELAANPRPASPAPAE